MNEALKQNIRAKVNSYLKRAEEIRENSKNGVGKKKTVAVGGNAKDNKDDDETDDPDRKRMMQKFEGFNIYHYLTNICFLIFYFQEQLLLIHRLHLPMWLG